MSEPPDGANVGFVKVIVTVLPDCTALTGTAPVGPLGPVRVTWNAAARPEGNVTGSEKLTATAVSIDRWAAPPLINKLVTVGTMMWRSATTGRWSVTVVRRLSTCVRLARSGRAVLPAELMLPLTATL